jgi:hypothetical protein
MVGHLAAQRMRPPLVNDEFVGMADYVMESFYDLLMGILRGSPTPTLVGEPSSLTRVFMVGGAHRVKTPEGHVTNVLEEEVNPPSDPDDGVRADGRVPPNPRLEQLRAR